MIVDCHTHVFLPKHVNESYIRFLKVETYRGIGKGRGLEWLNANPDKHFMAMSSVDRAVVLGLKGALANVSNDYIAEYVNSHKEKLIGFCSIDPFEKEAEEEIKRCISVLGLKGLKLHPTTQGFYPNDKKVYPIYEIAQELEIPIMVHAGAAGPTGPMVPAPLKFSQPIHFEDVAMDFPDLKMIIAHLGIPWESETLALIRKQPNVYADISMMAFRPFKLYLDLVMAMEYGVLDKLLLGSDYPWGEINQHIQVLKNINIYAENTNLPKIPSEAIKSIIEENAKKVLDL